MVKSSIFKYVQQYIYTHNLGYFEVLSENAINKVSQYYCVYT